MAIQPLDKQPGEACHRLSRPTGKEMELLTMLENDSIGNCPINDLFADLTKLHNVLCDPLVSMADDDYEKGWAVHWALREQIEAAPVTSLDDLAWIARTYQLEAKRDFTFDCDCPGSARALALALAAGALQLARIEASQKAARGAHLGDLAAWIDARREAAQKELQLTE